MGKNIVIISTRESKCGSTVFKNTPLNYVHECDLPRITLLSSSTNDDVIEKAVLKFNLNNKRSDLGFQIITMLYKIETVYSSLYGGLRMSSMEFGIKRSASFFCRKVVRKLWRLSYYSLQSAVHN